MNNTKYNDIKEKFGQELLDYINRSPTMFHAVQNAADMLAGFDHLAVLLGLTHCQLTFVSLL